MITLQARLEQGLTVFQQRKTLDDLETFLLGSEGSASKWGVRALTHSAFIGSVDLDWIGQRVMEIANEKSKTIAFTPRERVSGMRVVDTLHERYKEVKKAVAQAPFFTQIVYAIRQWGLWLYRRLYRACFNVDLKFSKKHFQAYPKEEYQKIFDSKSPKKKLYSPERLLASERAIRGLPHGEPVF